MARAELAIMADAEQAPTRPARGWIGRALNATGRPRALAVAAVRGPDAALLRPSRGRLGRAHAGRARSTTWRRSRRRCCTSPAPGAGPRPRHRDRRGGAVPRPRVPAGARPRRRHLRGDDPRARRPRSASTPRAGSRSRSPTRPPFPTATTRFDLVAQLNMPPFFAEIARVLRPGGHVSSPPAGRGDARSTPRARCSSAAFAGAESSRSAAGEAGAGHLLRRRASRPRATARSG